MSKIMFSLECSVQNNTIRCFIISPEDISYKILCFILVALSIYTCFVSLFKWTSMPRQKLHFLVLDNIINLLYIIDIFATFLVAYIDDFTFLRVDDPMRISKRYFKRLIIDLTLAFPFELIRRQFHASNLKYWICGLVDWFAYFVSEEF